MAIRFTVPESDLQEFFESSNKVEIELSSFRHETRQATFEWESTFGPDDTNYDFSVTVRDDMVFVTDEYVEVADYTKLEQERDELLETIDKLQARIEEQATTIIQMGNQLLANRPWWKFW